MRGSLAYAYAHASCGGAEEGRDQELPARPALGRRVGAMSHSESFMSEDPSRCEWRKGGEKEFIDSLCPRGDRKRPG